MTAQAIEASPTCDFPTYKAGHGWVCVLPEHEENPNNHYFVAA